VFFFPCGVNREYLTDPPSMEQAHGLVIQLVRLPAHNMDIIIFSMCFMSPWCSVSYVSLRAELGIQSESNLYANSDLNQYVASQTLRAITRKI
jgi:hypothetical protein